MLTLLQLKTTSFFSESLMLLSLITQSYVESEFKKTHIIQIARIRGTIC